MSPCLEARGSLAAQRQTMLHSLPSEAKDSPCCSLVQTQPGHPQREVALRTSASIPLISPSREAPKSSYNRNVCSSHLRNSPFATKHSRPDLFPKPLNPRCRFMPKQHQSSPPLPAAPGFRIHSLLELLLVPVSVAATPR